MNVHLLWFMIQLIYSSERLNLPLGINLPQVKNYWTRNMILSHFQAKNIRTSAQDPYFR